MIGPLATDIGDVVGFLAGVPAALAALVGLGTAVVGVRTYVMERRERRGRWLMDLQERFVSEPSFQTVRREIYNGDQSDLTKAWERNGVLMQDHAARESDPLTPDERKLLVALDDYLEFLALIHRLVEVKWLGERDAYTMFGWYGLNGTETKAISAEIEENFEQVGALRERFKRVHEEVTGERWVPSAELSVGDGTPPRIPPPA